MNLTLRQVLSLVKVPNKAVNADSRITSRYVYGLLKKNRDWLIKQIDSKYYLYELSYLFQSISCLDVIPVPTIDECCGIKATCKIYRTKDKLPEMLSSYTGPIIRRVTSADRSNNLTPTSAQEINRKLENPDMVKYDKGEYYFWENGYLYFPNIHWKKVIVEAFFLEDVSGFGSCGKDNNCKSILDEPFRIPADLLAQCIQTTENDLIPYQNIPDDNQIDKNPTRKN